MKFVSSDIYSEDYRKRRSAFLEELIASTSNVSVRAQEFRRWIDETRIAATMRKCKSWMDPAHSHDADWPPHQSVTIMDLVAGARAVDWDFTTWCYASGHDDTDPEARLMFECLLAYASRPEGRAGLN